MITPHERRIILLGARPSLLVEPDAAPDPGEVIQVHPQVAITITRHRRKGDKVEVFFIRHDNRPRLLHRDSSHGYTQNPALALPEEPEAPSPAFIDEDNLGRFVNLNNARRRERHRAESERESLLQRIQNAPPRTARTLRRELRRAEVFLAEAA